MSGDDSCPLLDPDSPPVTVTHYSKKGKVEKVPLSSESSSISPGGLSNGKTHEHETLSEEKEILIVEAPRVSNGKSNNPFLTESGEVKENPFDQLDAITSALLSMTSTNPFHNPFLMPSEPPKGHGTLSSDQNRDDPGCTKLSPVPRVSVGGLWVFFSSLLLFRFVPFADGGV
jgi:hypothetical protein